MAYTSGSSILASDYNTYVTTVNDIWGVGSGDTGWGQTNVVANTARNTTHVITASNEWNALVARMKNISSHLSLNASVSVDTATNPTAGTAISIVSNIPTDLTTLNNARLNNTANVSDTANPNTVNQSSAATWTTTRQHKFTVTFASNNQLRYWLNGGGKILMASTLTGYTGTRAKAVDWNNTLGTDVGTVTWGTNFSKTGGGTNSGNGLGFYSLTDSTNNQVVKVFSNSTTNPDWNNPGADAYGSRNYYEILINPGVKTSSTVLTVTINWNDAADDDATGGPGNNPSLDIIDGTLTSSITLRKPATTYLADVWGTITFANTVVL